MDVDYQSDAELVGLARADDKAAFGELADRHLPLAEHVAFQVVHLKGIAQARIHRRTA